MDVREEKTGSDFTLVRKTMTLGKALKEVVDQNSLLAGVKWLNPFSQILRKLTGRKNFTEYQRKVAENSRRIRSVVHDYVKKRKSGEIKS
jgi:tRNA U38,U39,U40 pseudouridine synthase TruA